MDAQQFDWLAAIWVEPAPLAVEPSEDDDRLYDDDKRERPEPIERIDPQTGFVSGCV